MNAIINAMLEYRYVLSVMADDHPGIIAGVSSVVAQLGGNIVSCSQTVLDGYFTFIAVVDLPKEYTPDEFAGIFKNAPELTGVQVLATQQKNGIRHAVACSDNYIITAIGKDRQGIVNEFSRYLAAHDINITDLFGGNRNGDFVMIGQLTIPDSVNIRTIKSDLEEIGKDYCFTVKVQHGNIFTATNRI